MASQQLYDGTHCNRKHFKGEQFFLAAYSLDVPGMLREKHGVLMDQTLHALLHGIERLTDQILSRFGSSSWTTTGLFSLCSI